MQFASGAQSSCDFGSEFRRIFNDPVPFIYPSSFERGTSRENVANTFTAAGAAYDKLRGRGRRRKIDPHSYSKDERKNRVPTLLETHQRVINAALLELSRPRGEPFGNLGESLGGEYDKFTYCDRYVKASVCSLKNVRRYTTKRCSSAGNGFGASALGRDRPRRRAKTASAEKKAVFPRLLNRNTWKTPLVKNGTMAGERNWATGDIFLHTESIPPPGVRLHDEAYPFLTAPLYTVNRAPISSYGRRRYSHSSKFFVQRRKEYAGFSPTNDDAITYDGAFGRRRSFRLNPSPGTREDVVKPNTMVDVDAKVILEQFVGESIPGGMKKEIVETSEGKTPLPDTSALEAESYGAIPGKVFVTISEPYTTAKQCGDNFGRQSMQVWLAAASRNITSRSGSTCGGSEGIRREVAVLEAAEARAILEQCIGELSLKETRAQQALASGNKTTRPGEAAANSDDEGIMWSEALVATMESSTMAEQSINEAGRQNMQAQVTVVSRDKVGQTRLVAPPSGIETTGSEEATVVTKVASAVVERCIRELTSKDIWTQQAKGSKNTAAWSGMAVKYPENKGARSAKCFLVALESSTIGQQCISEALLRGMQAQLHVASRDKTARLIEAANQVDGKTTQLEAAITAVVEEGVVVGEYTEKCPSADMRLQLAKAPENDGVRSDMIASKAEDNSFTSPKALMVDFKLGAMAEQCIQEVLKRFIQAKLSVPLRGEATGPNEAATQAKGAVLTAGVAASEAPGASAKGKECIGVFIFKYMQDERLGAFESGPGAPGSASRGKTAEPGSLTTGADDESARLGAAIVVAADARATVGQYIQECLLTTTRSQLAGASEKDSAKSGTAASETEYKYVSSNEVLMVASELGNVGERCIHKVLGAGLQTQISAALRVEAAGLAGTIKLEGGDGMKSGAADAVAAEASTIVEHCIGEMLSKGTRAQQQSMVSEDEAMLPSETAGEGGHGDIRSAKSLVRTVEPVTMTEQCINEVVRVLQNYQATLTVDLRGKIFRPGSVAAQVGGESTRLGAAIAVAAEARANVGKCIHKYLLTGMRSQLVEVFGNEGAWSVPVASETEGTSREGVMVASELGSTAERYIQEVFRHGLQLQLSTAFRNVTAGPNETFELGGGSALRPVAASSVAVGVNDKVEPCINESIGKGMQRKSAAPLGDETVRLCAAASYTEGEGAKSNKALLITAKSSFVVEQRMVEATKQSVQAQLVVPCNGETSIPGIAMNSNGACLGLSEKVCSRSSSSAGFAKEWGGLDKCNDSRKSGATTPISSGSSSVQFTLLGDQPVEPEGTSIAYLALGDKASLIHDGDATVPSSNPIPAGNIFDGTSLSSSQEKASGCQGGTFRPGGLITIIQTVAATKVEAYTSQSMLSAAGLPAKKAACSKPGAGPAADRSVRRANIPAEPASGLVSAVAEELTFGAFAKDTDSIAPHIPAGVIVSDLSSPQGRYSTEVDDKVHASGPIPARDEKIVDVISGRTLGAQLVEKSDIPQIFLGSILEGRRNLKPTIQSRKNLPGHDPLKAGRLQQAKEEAEVKERATELRELEALVRTNRFNQYAPDDFLRGALYGEGKHSVVYRAEARSHGEGEIEGHAVAGVARETAVTRSLAGQKTMAAIIEMGAITSAVNSAAVQVPMVEEKGKAERLVFAAKEFRYARVDAPVSILRDVRREVAMHLRLCDCHRVVALHGVWLTPRVTLLLEPMDGGSLHRFIRTHKCEEKRKEEESGHSKKLALAEAANVVADIADGLAVLHGAGIVHRDVKSYNVLMTRRRSLLKKSDINISGAKDSEKGNGSEMQNETGCGDGESEWEAKLGDLGSAALIPAEGETSLTEEAGTSGWVAPEVRETFT